MEGVHITIAQLVLAVVFGTVSGFLGCVLAMMLGDLLGGLIESTWNKRYARANAELQQVASSRPAGTIGNFDDDILE